MRSVSEQLPLESVRKRLLLVQGNPLLIQRVCQPLFDITDNGQRRL